jgi:hypothetical protein
VKAEKAMSLSREPRQKWNSRDQWVQETVQVNSPLAPHALRLRVCAMLSAPCALRYFEVIMPAIASLEDLKAAQKEGVSISLCGRQWD